MRCHALLIMTLLQLPCHIRYLSVTSQLLMRYLSKTCVEKLTVLRVLERMQNVLQILYTLLISLGL